MGKVDKKFDQTTKTLVDNLKIARMALTRHLGDGSKVQNLAPETVDSLSKEASNLVVDVHSLLSRVRTEAPIPAPAPAQAPPADPAQPQ